MSCGIYAIRNTINGKIYIGSTKYLEKRFGEHKRLLKRGVHHSVVLQRAWYKYGEDAFEFLLLKECDEDSLIEEEQKLIEGYQSYSNINGYNVKMQATGLPDITGENHGLSKLSWKEVWKIRALYCENDFLTFKELGKMFNVTGGNIRLIIRNEAWVDPEYKDVKRNRRNKPRHRTTFVWEDIDNIRKLYMSGKSISEIRKIDSYKSVPYSTVFCIAKNVYWCDEEYGKLLEGRVPEGQLPSDLVSEIRELYRNSEEGMEGIAKRYGLPARKVRSIIEGKMYADKNYVYKGKPGGPGLGENHHSSILTRENVESIRKEYNDYTYTFFQLMEKYGVAYGAIQKVIENKNWVDSNYVRTRFRSTKKVP